MRLKYLKRIFFPQEPSTSKDYEEEVKQEEDEEVKEASDL